MTTGPSANPQQARGTGGVEVSVSGVAKTFRQGDQVTHAVAGADFTAGPSEFVSLIGPSGCGKTTVMRMVADLIAPTSGSITVGGQTPSAARRDRRFGFVFQEATLLGWRSLRDNVTLPMQVIGVPKRERLERANDLLRLVDLQEFADHYPDQVSGGMQQRAAIARALSFQPSVLLMDEPFGALDMITRDRMSFELLRIWEEERKTVLFITHSIQEAVLLSDKVVIFSARPSTVQAVVPIELPRPRTVEHRESQLFLEYTREFRKMLAA